MPKLIDLVKTLTGRLNSNELSALVGASDPWSQDISEEEFSNLETQVKGLVTIDSAVNNEAVYKALEPKIKQKIEGDIHGSMKQLIYSKAEEALEPLGAKFGVDLKGKKINEIVSTLSSIDLGNGKTNDDYQALQNDFNKFKEDSESKLKEQASGFEDFKRRSILRDKLSSYTLAKPYQETLIRDSILDKAIEKLESQAVYKLDDSGRSISGLYKKDNPDIELYGDNNKKLSINDLIDPIMQPYVSTKPDTNPSDTPKPEITIDKLQPEVNSGSAVGGVKAAEKMGVKY